MKGIIVLSMLIAACNARAFQTFDVKNGSEIRASVYKAGLSRIYLQDDRITAVKAMAGEFQIDKNDEIGDIYLKPLASRSSDELDLFIQSEKGNTYSLRLMVNAEKPESIRLDANDLNEPSVNSFTSQTIDSQAQIIELIKIASQGYEIKGYSSEVFSEPSRLNLKKNVVSILEKTYQGREYRIDILRIENNTKERVNIHERDLAEGMSVVAVSLETRSLDERQSTKAYRVVKL